MADDQEVRARWAKPEIFPRTLASFALNSPTGFHTDGVAFQPQSACC